MAKNQNSLKINNKGFTLATLLVIMLLTSVLAMLLLTVTVINVQTKQVDRKSKETFYLAESIADEIRAGIESELGDALGEAYKEALPKFGSTTNDDLKAQYKKSIITTLFSKYVNDPTKVYTDNYESGINYDVGILKGYLSDKNKENIKSVLLGHGAGSSIYVDKETGQITLKAVSITYTTNDGYQSRTQMDFVIKVPDLRFDNPGFYLTLGDYSIITDGELKNDINKTEEIYGSVYAAAGIKTEGMDTDGIGASVIKFHSDNVVTRNAITADSGSTIYITGTNETEACNIWADIMKTSSVRFPSTTAVSNLQVVNGICYVKNDLVLDAKSGNNVSIKGDYFGFGCPSNSDDNSAIIINGRKSTLDLTQVAHMMIAGRSYIDVNSENGVLMGESLSVKANQVAYLVPDEYVRGGSNPTIAQEPDEPEVDFRPKELRDFDEDSYTSYINDYKAQFNNNEAEEIANGSILQYLNLNNDTVGYKKIYAHDKLGQLQAYYYLEFRSEKLANKYFNEYYEANKERIDERTRLYVDSIKLSENDDEYSIVGNLTSYDEGKAQVIYQAEPENLASISDVYMTQYKNMIYNLYDSGSASEVVVNNSLFNKYIDITAFREPLEVYELNSTTKAVFVNNVDQEFKISTEFGNAGNEASGIIVATGKVVVDMNFKGTIISQGGIIYSGENHTLTADKTTVYQLLSPSNPQIIRFFKELSGTLANGSNGSDMNINIHELVDIQNWKRN